MLPLAAAAPGEPIAAGNVTVLIRPEQLELIAGPGARPGSGCLSGRIVAREYYGHDAVVRVQPDGGPDGLEVIVRTTGEPQLPAGESVTIRARGPVIAWTR